MVREIIHAQVGQCGNQIGTAFWKTMGGEHLIQADGAFSGDISVREDALRLAKIGVYYRETQSHRFVPRSVMVDLEPGTMDAVKSSDVGDLFSVDNYVFGASGAGNVWAKGHYTDGNELIDEVTEVIRREVEQCDCVQGIQLTHSMGGGTGSGLGTLLLLKHRDTYPDRITASFSVFPSKQVSDVVVEPYNSVLSMHQLLENADETFIIDNEALFNISQNVLRVPEPRFRDLNAVVSLVMSGVTSSLRFPGKLNSDLRKMSVNLVPFPRLHFFLESVAPLFSEASASYVGMNVRELNAQCWDPSHFLANVRPEDGKYLAAALVFRGNIPTGEVDTQTALTQSRLADSFVNWIPHNIKSSIVDVPPNSETPMSASFVANSTAIKGVFERISHRFARMYKRKAFLSWYLGEGMDELEFEEADQNVRDLIQEYQDKQDAQVDEDGNDLDLSDEEQEDSDFW